VSRASSTQQPSELQNQVRSGGAVQAIWRSLYATVCPDEPWDLMFPLLGFHLALVQFFLESFLFLPFEMVMFTLYHCILEILEVGNFFFYFIAAHNQQIALRLSRDFGLGLLSTTATVESLGTLEDRMDVFDIMR
jgi:hypothetical protein